MGNSAKQCRLGPFEDSDFAGDLEDSKSTSGGTSCIFGSHTCVPISWMCKKQTSVSHCSIESKIMVDLGQEWKSGAAEHDRSGKPEKTSRDMMQKVGPHREEPLLDGNAHSARYGETVHDGSGKPETVILWVGEQDDRTTLQSIYHMHRWPPLQRRNINKNRLILKISSWEVTQLNLWTKSKTKCETDSKECRTLKSQVKSIQ